MSSVSVVIPNYNGQALLQSNLPYVFAMLRNEDEVVIVDDASTDNSVEWMKSEFDLKLCVKVPEYQACRGCINLNGKKINLKIVQNGVNLRFAMSCNRGVQLAQHPYIFLLNTDVRPTEDIVPKLLQHFEDPHVFAVGCHEIEEHEGGISGGKNRLWFSRGMFMHSRAKDFKTGETAWASGGSAMFDKEKWMELGGFDKAYYPAYWEDVDISYRARKRGWKVLFEAEAIVHHNHESTNKPVFGQSKMDTMSWNNSLTFVKKNGNPWQQLQHLIWKPYWHWQRAKLENT